ncbi:hypothetical protein OAG92_01750 [Akkermansiaceae bacterium]|jgi:hypothetical protein|nr:hypothetical protein [bacterium]MDB4708069.1 hypothetical protein [Akkermansiaceae bacterium]MDB4800947.1 hypothetical protein [Akkermansiaceae bacterium]
MTYLLIMNKEKEAGFMRMFVAHSAELRAFLRTLLRVSKRIQTKSSRTHALRRGLRRQEPHDQQRKAVRERGWKTDLVRLPALVERRIFDRLSTWR